LNLEFLIFELYNFDNFIIAVMLTVYKASAGSGKTFQLVVEYLKLVAEKSTKLQAYSGSNFYQQSHQRNENQYFGNAE
jgi:hypothetical protein